MPISDKEREAYRKGEDEANFIRDNPISYLLTGGIHSRPDEPNLAAAFDKGFAREQLDKDKK
ncbi:MAG: hypothetical protein WC565_02280 [Parcubacteria group bacterium]